jgi:hypothetical protein
MAWETRKGRGGYYTRSKRVGGRVVREYVGTGPVAEAVAALDACERSERLAEREAWIRRREEMETTSKAVERFTADVHAVTRATLEAAGYHQHHRGEWRKRADG